jgi:hypothetical protein
VTEIRLLADRPTKGVWSGFFDRDHADQLVSALRPLPDGAREKIPYGEHPRVGEANVYFTLNPVKPALHARSANEFNKCQATADCDIVAYTLFPVDVDPVRQSGISATDAEKAEALKVIAQIEQFFTARGVTPIRADSGNGYHLLIPTITYTDVPAAAAQAHQLQKLLHLRFSTDAAKVDTTVFNPGRIFKLYGSLSMKGSDTPDRPHRYARILLPKKVTNIDLFDIVNDDLDAFAKQSVPAAPAKAAGNAKPSRSRAASGWDHETSKGVLAGVLERAGFEYRTKTKEGSELYVFFECPHHTDPNGDRYECCAIVRPDGSYAGKCMHDDEAGWTELKAAIGWTTHIAEVMTELGLAAKPPYQESPSGLTWFKHKGDDIVPVRLTNFTTRIVNDVCEDDGFEQRRTFELESTLCGKQSRFCILSNQFSAMNWPVEHLGARAVVFPGQGTREHARVAIQQLSGDIPTEHVFTHVGWRLIDGRYVYLHAGGAIGPDGPMTGVRVALSAPFDRYLLPEPPGVEVLREAVKASGRLTNVAPDEVSVPLFACVWRAPLGAIDFTPFLTGPSGAGKSELAALVQQHWGAG